MKSIRTILRTIRHITVVTLEVFIAMLTTLCLCSVVLSGIGINPESHLPGEQLHTVFITSNGVHTDIVVPATEGPIDWIKALQLPDSMRTAHNRSHLAIGWGDKGFFLETKDWSDLRVSVALKAAFHLGNSAIHVVQVPKPEPGASMVIELKLNRSQYDRLLRYIQSSFDRDHGELVAITPHPYGKFHHFFEARRSYGLTYTCNSWTNSALKSCGQRACIWTLLKDGIYNQYTQ